MILLFFRSCHIQIEGPTALDRRASTEISVLTMKIYGMVLLYGTVLFMVSDADHDLTPYVHIKPSISS